MANACEVYRSEVKYKKSSINCISTY